MLETIGIIVMCVTLGFFAGWWLREYTKKSKLPDVLIASNDMKRDAIQAGMLDETLRANLEMEKEKRQERLKYISDCIDCRICPVCRSPIKMVIHFSAELRCTNELCGWRQFDTEVNS